MQFVYIYEERSNYTDSYILQLTIELKVTITWIINPIKFYINLKLFHVLLRYVNINVF